MIDRVIKIDRQVRGKSALLLFLIVSFLFIFAGIIVGCAAPVQIIEDITSEEANVLIQDNLDNPDFVIIDIRNRFDYEAEHIENAINLEYYSVDFRDKLDELDRKGMYLIYCQTARTSGETKIIMEELKFREVYHMLGGIKDWKEWRLPTVP